MKRENGVSILPCKVNGLNLKFIFDTGASDVSISMTEATFMLKNEYLDEDDIIGKSKYQDANGTISEGVNINLRELEIGGLKLYNVKASVVKNLKAPLLLGQSAISKLGVVQLDLEANTLTIFPKKDNSLSSGDESKSNQVADTLVAHQPVQSKIENLFSVAYSFYRDKEYQQSISKCDLILLDDPKNTKVLFLKAVNYDLLEDYSSAIKVYTRILELEPKDEIVYSYRGKSKFDNKDYAGALIDLNKGLVINPTYLKGYKWRAETKEAMKNIAGAISDFDKAISIAPLDSSLYVDRAFVKHKNNDFKGAIVDCNKAINIYPEYASAYYCRGISKQSLKDFSGAIDDFNMALKCDYDFPEAYMQRGRIKENQYQDLNGAMEDYESALALDPDNIFAGVYKTLLQDKIKQNVWLKACESSTGDNWYIYNSVVLKEGSKIKIWVKTDFKTLTIRSNGKSSTYTNAYKLTLCLFHCTNMEYKILNIKSYDSKGKLIEGSEYSEFEAWDTPAPQTVIESVLKKVCELYN